MGFAYPTDPEFRIIGIDEWERLTRVPREHGKSVLQTTGRSEFGQAMRDAFAAHNPTATPTLQQVSPKAARQDRIRATRGPRAARWQ